MGLHKLFDEDYQEEVVYVEKRNVNKIAGTLYYTAKMKDLERVITSNNWKNHYKDVKLVHQSLPNMNVADVDLRTHYYEQDFSFPIYINAMTGGSEKTLEINPMFLLV